LDIARTGAFDVILLDIMLPGLSGYRVLQQLRAEGVSTPVLLENATGDLTVNSLMVVDSLRVPFGTVSVNYNPSVLLPGVGAPVLIR